METLLKFLSGKKGTIASILGTVLAYCAATGLLWPQEVILIGSLITIIFGWASIATKGIYKK